jgi:hypothetical protein
MNAWIAHLRGVNGPVDDPLADDLSARIKGLDDPAAHAGLIETLAIKKSI